MKKDENSIVQLDIDEETGEATTRIFVELNEGDKIVRKRQIDYLNYKEAHRQFLTEFFWMLFKYGRPLPIDVSCNFLPCLVLLAASCPESGLIGRKDMVQSLAGLNKNQWSSFWREATQKDLLLLSKGDAVYINHQYFRKGELQTSSDFIRVFSGCYQALYEGAAGSLVKQRHLSYILQMIPYLNRQTNILSYNGTEQRNENVAYMTLYDYCDITGYDRSHAATLKRQISEFRVDGELIVGFFDDLSALSEKGKYVIVNPRLCFGGDRNLAGYEKACELFLREKERAT